MRKTKIVCTIGPASDSKETLVAMAKAGMNVARLNFSHGTHEEHLDKIRKIKEVREELGLPIAILLDTKGPEYRIKTFENGKIFLNEGDIAIGLTTSGRSENVLLALERAKANGAFTIAMTGRNCSPEAADLIIGIPSDLTPHIQEMHMLIGHYWADFAENNI